MFFLTKPCEFLRDLRTWSSVTAWAAPEPLHAEEKRPLVGQTGIIGDFADSVANRSAQSGTTATPME